MNHRSLMRKMCLVFALLLSVSLASVTAQCMDGVENETRTAKGMIMMNDDACMHGSVWSNSLGCIIPHQMHATTGY